MPLWWKKVPWSTTNEDTSAFSSTQRKDHDFEHAASYKSMDEDTTTQISSTSQQYADIVQDCSFFFHDTKDKGLANNSIMSNTWLLFLGSCRGKKPQEVGTDSKEVKL